MSKAGEVNKELYDKDKDFKEYVDRFARHNSIPFPDVFEYAMIGCYREYHLKNKEGKINEKHNG